ncbi:MAG: phage head closure protein [Pseudomonadota bacterium]
MYRLGQLDQRIQFERDIKASDDMGGNTATPQIIATVWSYVRQKSTRELLQAHAVAATASKIFVIRFRADLLPSDRIIWRGVRYNIRMPFDENSSEAFLEIEAECGVAQ